ncbi:TPA: hypothetical protein ACNUZQ_001060 [Citrobacter braakii]|nr:hypothetical protein SK36_01579 [Citrobacter sp. MGH106]
MNKLHRLAFLRQRLSAVMIVYGLCPFSRRSTHTTWTDSNATSTIS